MTFWIYFRIHSNTSGDNHTQYAIKDLPNNPNWDHSINGNTIWDNHIQYTIGDFLNNSNWDHDINSNNRGDNHTQYTIKDLPNNSCRNDRYQINYIENIN